MKRIRRKLVSTYDGVSEFALATKSSYMGTSRYVYVYAYNILRPDSWQRMRQSVSIITISHEGLYIGLHLYEANRRNIDIDDHSQMVLDGVDFI
jgi:hypothetical protein